MGSWEPLDSLKTLDKLSRKYDTQLFMMRHLGLASDIIEMPKGLSNDCLII